MRILFVANVARTRLHAVPRILHCLGDEMVGRGHRVDLVLAPDVPLGRVPEPLRPLAFAVAVAPRLLAADRRGQYDIIATHSGCGWVYGALRRAVRRAGARYVILSQGWEDLYWARYLAAVRNGVATVTRRHRLRYEVVNLGQVHLALRFADQVICCARDERQDILARHHLPPSRVSVVPNGVSAGYFVRRRRGDPVSPSLLFVGQWYWAKGPHVLAEVYENLLQEYPGTPLSLVGTRVSASEVLDRFSSDARRTLRVLPEVDEGLLQQEYRSHETLLQPSLSEGLALVVLEGMAASMAVVTTDVGGMKEVITSGVDGLIVPSGNSEAFLQATRHLLADAELRTRLGDAARETARSYTWDNIATRMLGVFEGLLK